MMLAQYYESAPAASSGCRDPVRTVGAALDDEARTQHAATLGTCVQDGTLGANF